MGYGAADSFVVVSLSHSAGELACWGVDELLIQDLPSAKLLSEWLAGSRRAGCRL
jgi:hypothetical protein